MNLAISPVPLCHHLPSACHRASFARFGSTKKPCLTSKVYLTEQKKYYIMYSSIYPMYTICRQYVEDTYV